MEASFAWVGKLHYKYYIDGGSLIPKLPEIERKLPMMFDCRKNHKFFFERVDAVLSYV